MSLHARLPGLGWDELLSLLVRVGAEGALRVESDLGALDLIFTNGVVLLPLARTSGSRKDDQRRGNRRLLKALRARRVSFRFQAGETPPGTVARRTLVLRQEPLLREAATRRPRGVNPGEPVPALWGDVPGSWVAGVLRALGAHRRSGRLVLEGDQGQRAILRLEAGELRPATPDQEALRALRRDVLAVCRASLVRVAFLAEGEAAEAGPLPPETGRLLAALTRVEELWRRVHKLMAANHTAFRLRDPARRDEACALTGLPPLVGALDGRRNFAEVLEATGLPPLLAAHGLARLLLEGLVAPARRPESAPVAREGVAVPGGSAGSAGSELGLGSGDLRALASPSDAAPQVAAAPLGLEGGDAEAAAGDDGWPAPRVTDSRRLTPIVASRGPTPVPRRATIRPAATRMRILRAS